MSPNLRVLVLLAVVILSAGTLGGKYGKSSDNQCEIWNGHECSDLRAAQNKAEYSYRPCDSHGCHVLAAGMQRSGSTWQFNVVRLLLNTSLDPGLPGVALEANHQSKDGARKFDALARPFAVVKSHAFDPDAVARAGLGPPTPATCVLLAHRDARDIMLSWLRWNNATPQFDLPPTLQLEAFTLRWTEENLHWRDWCFARTNRCCHVMSYEDLMTEPVGQIRAIAQAFNVIRCGRGRSAERGDPCTATGTINVTQIQDRVSALLQSTRVSGTGWDGPTAFSSNHVTNGGSRMWELGRGDMDKMDTAERSKLLRRWDRLFARYHEAWGYPRRHTSPERNHSSSFPVS